MLIALGITFAIIGITSSIIGLGGGTFYLLAMQLFELPYLLIPIIALMCNIIVSGLSAGIRLIQKQYCSPWFLMVILIPSMLTSYLGASLFIQESSFKLVLNALLLLIIVIRVLLQYKVETKKQTLTLKSFKTRESIEQNFDTEIDHITFKTYFKYMIISACIGLASGVIGIGGGIILGPILYIYGVSYGRIPLITAIYIFFNSIVGFIVHLNKLDSWVALGSYLFLPIISALSVILTMMFITKRITSNQVRYIAFAAIIIITIYKLIRIGVIYVG